MITETVKKDISHIFEEREEYIPPKKKEESLEEKIGEEEEDLEAETEDWLEFIRAAYRNDVVYEEEHEYRKVADKLKTDRFAAEFKPDWYIRYRTVGQNYRNVTALRDIMGYLQSRGYAITKKVK